VSVLATAERGEQYSLAKILGIWALAAAPMGVLSWIVFPLLAPDAGSDPLGAGVTRLALLTLGLVWLFVLSLIIVRREEGDLRWATLMRRLRLNAPRDPMTGEPRKRLWLWVVPFLAADHRRAVAEPPRRQLGRLLQPGSIGRAAYGGAWAAGTHHLHGFMGAGSALAGDHAYSVSKAGIRMLARQMARELAGHGILVNVIAPGIVRAGLAKQQMETEPQYARRIKHVIPLGEPQTAEQVARATAFLCSEAADYMTGSTLLVDGGCSLFQFDE
jgi:hypothetical protein